MYSEYMTLEDKMKLWRMGMIPFPQEYIDYNAKKAHESKEQFKEKFIIHSETMIDDGWADGMQVLQLVLENKKTEELMKVKYQDNGCWYSKYPSGGWTILDTMIYP